MLILTPEVGVPFAEDTTPVALRGYKERAAAMFASLHDFMNAENVEYSELEITEEDKKAARASFSIESTAPITTPGAAAHLEALLSAYDHEIVNVHIRLRAYITNRLLETSDNPDPKVRLRALELLGKLSDVGAFTERVRVEVSNQTPEELEQAIMDKMKRYMDASVVAVQEYANPEPIEALDVDLLLGDGE